MHRYDDPAFRFEYDKIMEMTDAPLTGGQKNDRLTALFPSFAKLGCWKDG